MPTQTQDPFLAEPVDLDKIVRDLPSGDRWIRHLHEDLLPFWTTEVALGSPIGRFPTYRHDDGSAVDPHAPGPEFLRGHVADGIAWLDREHVRANSRQIYAYGVAYHLTGNRDFLSYAEAGADYLLRNAFDPEGGAFSYFDRNSGQWGPPANQRTSQDLAYALTGIGFLYYLTRRPELADVLLKVHEYIFQRYYDPEIQLFRWVLEPSPDGDRTDQKELVAQLDQIYGYMLLVAPILPKPHRMTWLERLKMIARRIMQQFYAPSTEMFWGALTSPAAKQLGTPHTDFGHSIKTFWLISLIGESTDDYEMFTAAQRRAAQVLDWAYIPRSGSWARAFDRWGRLDEDKEWWILCELDQVAGALALNDTAYARYLVRTYQYWFQHMVDHRHHEVWHMVSGITNTPVSAFPKQHSWKNALHSFEHALVSYLVGQVLHDLPVELYYAFESVPEHTDINPYFYIAKVDSLEAAGPEAKLQKVVFSDIH
ncbi:MAG: hypothetical protein JO069_05420 [Verrucomicrobia bacterium]|nr:hypothetical protein [Verrucomicrobiota bacterium]